MIHFVALDFETANASRSSVCSIGLAKVAGSEITDTYYSLVNPGEQFDSRNIAVHGIHPADVQDAPTFQELYEDVFAFIGHDPIVAHFAQFDINVLRGTAEKYALPLPDNPYFCSCMLAKKLLKLPSHKLNVVADHFDFQFEHHNALEDAIACATIVIHMTKEHSSLHHLLSEIDYSFGYLNGPAFHKNKAPRKKTPVKVELDKHHPFYEKSLCFTGTLTSMKRADAIELVTKRGAHVHTSLKKDTDYLIVGESDAIKYRKGQVSSKIQQAKEWQQAGYKVKLVSEHKFFGAVFK
ncbi:exonuclease domain-containing protein [Domibacillus aminovorans]|uniref:exonuclease domain-containing protein n=1 Tax=Domibacillus aminovorans TaxID=29332 RepID=UPI0007C645E7|nr:exonuclease domain-containing protein [Domibacillus aminovorans]